MAVCHSCVVGAFHKNEAFSLSSCVYAVSSALLGLRIPDITANGFTLEWTPPSTPNEIIEFYQVALFTANNLDLLTLNPINVSSTSYTFTGLAPFTGYSVQVCSYTIECGDIATLNVTTLGGEGEMYSAIAGQSATQSMYVLVVITHCILFTLHCNIYCIILFVPVPPKVSPSDGISNKPILTGDPVTISFAVMNEPVPKVTREGIQWVFMGSGGAVNLSCTSTLKYTFSDDCLNLTVNNTVGSDAGLYQITITTEGGVGMSAVGISVSGGELCEMVCV